MEEFGFSEPICGEYFTFTFWSNSFAQSIKYFVLIFNIILRSGVIFIMSMVGYPTLSKEMQRVTIVTFLCYFFNTGFIVTLVAADCSEQPLLGSIIHGGDRGDFNQEFFQTTASSLAGTMYLNAFMPIIYFIMYGSLRFISRCRDRSYRCCRQKDETTKKTSMQ